ncbi:hypothetical protein GYMLUDRAFT_67968 [Collybiopsis luxurians FD-317 M1]|nr:hypothetical protein GYMLUDRAFT_67968 [Collybiopsis luxurians FD-317 M1]
MLPEELLLLIVEHLAVHKPDFVEHELPEFHYRHTTEEIRSLSLVSHRMRRICMPFLFAYVLVDKLSGMRSFRDQCLANPGFAYSIKTLSFDHIHETEGSDILRRLLPRLKRLAWVHLHYIETDAALFTALSNQDNIRTVVIEELSDLPRADLDLSKILLCDITIGQPTCLPSRIPRGIRVGRIAIRLPYKLQEEFGLQRYNELRELDLIMGDFPVTLSWLPKFSSAVEEDQVQRRNWEVLFSS